MKLLKQPTGWRRYLDLKAKLLKFTDGSAFDCFSVAFNEISIAQVLITLLPGDLVVPLDLQGMSYGNRGALFTAS